MRKLEFVNSGPSAPRVPNGPVPLHLRTGPAERAPDRRARGQTALQQPLNARCLATGVLETRCEDRVASPAPKVITGGRVNRCARRASPLWCCWRSRSWPSSSSGRRSGRGWMPARPDQGHVWRLRPHFLQPTRYERTPALPGHRLSALHGAECADLLAHHRPSMIHGGMPGRGVVRTPHHLPTTCLRHLSGVLARGHGSSVRFR
jgi:hypothetical protein